MLQDCFFLNIKLESEVLYEFLYFQEERYNISKLMATEGYIIFPFSFPLFLP